MPLTRYLNAFMFIFFGDSILGSIFFIGLISPYFNKNIIFRIGGVLSGAILFFILTNFGVWSLGSYGYAFDGLVLCYILAIPFFSYSLISTFKTSRTKRRQKASIS